MVELPLSGEYLKLNMERTNLALAIQHVLIQTGNAILPGIGVLRLKYHPARLSRREGMIYPPSEVPEFEVLDDLPEPEPGLIREYLLAEQEADEAIGVARLKRVLADLRESLDRDQSVELPEVGEFYKEAGRIDFRPGSFNYYLEVFGLGPVQARPVMRRTPEQAARLAQESRATRLPETKTVAQVNKRKDRWVLPALATVLVLALAGCIWLILAPPSLPTGVSQAGLDQGPESVVSDEDMPRTSDPGDLTEQILGEDPDTVQQAVEDIAPTAPHGMRSNEDESTPRFAQNQVRIVAGHFANPENVAGLIDRLKEMGFNAQSEPGKGGLTRVFVLVAPDTSDAMEILARIQKDVEPTAWILTQ